MRTGTWNLKNGLMTEKHRNLILKQDCGVWLLTEVHPKWAENDGTKILSYNANISMGEMERNQHWTADLRLLTL
jgi:hypothetical protein